MGRTIPSYRIASEIMDNKLIMTINMQKHGKYKQLSYRRSRAGRT